MLRKILSFFIALIMLIPCTVTAAADTSNVFECGADEACILMEGVSKTVLADKNAGEVRDVAGLVRLPALLAVCEAVDEGRLSKTEIITVSREAASVGGVSAFLESGEEISVDLLLKSAVMIGAFDAVYALCESVCASEKEFVEDMNSRLAELGVDVRCSDIKGTNLKMSAYDAAKIGAELALSETFKEYASIYYDTLVHADGRETELANPNKLIKSLPGCIGGVTGSSSGAGYCGVFAVEENGAVYVTALLGSKNSASRFETARNANEYVLAKFKTNCVAKKGDVMAENIKVLAGTHKSVDLAAKSDLVLTVDREQDYEAVLNIPNEIEAPFTKNDVVARIEYRTSGDGKLIGTLDLCPCEDVKRASFWDNVFIVLRLWLHA